MELLVVMAPVCSDAQGVSSAEADVKEKIGSVVSVTMNKVLSKLRLFKKKVSY